MQKNLLIRHRVNKIVRDYLDERGFIEVETPLLTKPTPEGARDYLVQVGTEREIFCSAPIPSTF